MCDTCDAVEDKTTLCPTQQLIRAISGLKSELADGLAGIRLAVERSTDTTTMVQCDLTRVMDDLGTVITDLGVEVRDLDHTISGVTQ